MEQPMAMSHTKNLETGTTPGDPPSDYLVVVLERTS